MITLAKNLYDYRELMATLAWKNIALRYKQAYLGIAWAILKPITLMLMLMLIFALVKSFAGIESGEIPYPILVFAALMPWTFFQESASEAVPISAYDAFAAPVRHGEIEQAQLTAWNAVIGLRNRIVHAYMNIDMAKALELVSQGRHAFVTEFLLTQPISKPAP